MKGRDPIEADLFGRVAVVTGASGGIGLEVTKNLARLGAQVILACRSAVRGEAARQAVAAAVPGARLEVAEVDVSSRASVRAFGEAACARHPRIHILVNNAGVWLMDREESPDGVERIFATNVLGYHRVAACLMPALKAAAPSRIVNVASTYVEAPDLEDLEWQRRPFDGMAAYRASKAANRMQTWALAGHLEGTGVTANALHPGGIYTGIYRHPKGLFGAAVRAYSRLVKGRPEAGADTPTFLAADPALAEVTGRFFVDRKAQPCAFRDPEAVARLWAACEGYGASWEGRSHGAR